jgi:hypothetical protein
LGLAVTLCPTILDLAATLSPKLLGIPLKIDLMGLPAVPDPRTLSLAATLCSTTLGLAATPSRKLLGIPLKIDPMFFLFQILLIFFMKKN